MNKRAQKKDATAVATTESKNEVGLHAVKATDAKPAPVEAVPAIDLTFIERTKVFALLQAARQEREQLAQLHQRQEQELAQTKASFHAVEGKIMAYTALITPAQAVKAS